MALSHDQVQALLKLPEKSQRGRKPKNFIDTTVRDYQTWFKLATKFYETNAEGEQQRALCSNPNCTDTRDKKSVLVAEVNGQNMCRICFLSGFGTVNIEQLTTDTVEDE